MIGSLSQTSRTPVGLKVELARHEHGVQDNSDHVEFFDNIVMRQLVAHGRYAVVGHVDTFLLLVDDFVSLFDPFDDAVMLSVAVVLVLASGPIRVQEVVLWVCSVRAYVCVLDHVHVHNTPL